MFVHTMSYFLAWGVVYGILLGAFTGTAVFPFIGTMAGAVLGFAGGVVGGIIAGLAAATFGTSHIDMDTDLDTYRRQLARHVGLSVVIVPLIVWTVGSFLIRGVIGMGLFLPLALPWAGLASAYIAQRYPDMVARRLVKSKRGAVVDESDLGLRQVRVVPSASLLWNSGSRILRGLIGAALFAFIHLQLLLNYSSGIPLGIAKGMEVIVIGALGAIAAELMWGYVAIANSLLLTFIKQVILYDYFPRLSPVRSRRILTGIAFLFTLPIVWWTSVFTVVFTTFIAGLTAYHVYHTLALPEATQEKAKRKEKNALALEDESADEDEDHMLIDEEELMQEREQR